MRSNSIKISLITLLSIILSTKMIKFVLPPGSILHHFRFQRIRTCLFWHRRKLLRIFPAGNHRIVRFRAILWDRILQLSKVLWKRCNMHIPYTTIFQRREDSWMRTVCQKFSWTPSKRFDIQLKTIRKNPTSLLLLILEWNELKKN